MKEVLRASSWSILTEVVAKVVSPISFLVLTRILSPEDFGVVAVATTFISFIAIVTNLGVSKVIIQNPNYHDENYLFRLNNTCFLFNIAIGLFLFLLTVTFARDIATFFGNENSTLVVRVMALQILFFSLSSVQNANLKKVLKFKFLFYTRLITIGMPILLSIPIALLGGGYWAIVIGTVSGSFFNTILLWTYSDWKPTWLLDIDILKEVLGKGIWSSFDDIIVWIPIGLDAYLIGNYLSISDLGLYTTSRTLFSAAISITLGAILPVLYSHLSKIQKNEVEFKKTIMFSQKVMYTLAATLGLSVYLLSDIIENVFFNENWKGISSVLGIIFLVMSNGYFYSVLQEGLRSKGYFKELFLVKFSSIFIIIPLLFIAADTTIYIYSLVRGLVLYIWIFGMFYYARKKLGITFYSFVNNSKNILKIVLVVPALVYVLEENQEYLLIEIVTAKVILFVVMISTVVYVEKRLLLRIIKVVKKR